MNFFAVLVLIFSSCFTHAQWPSQNFIYSGVSVAVFGTNLHLKNQYKGKAQKFLPLAAMEIGDGKKLSVKTFTNSLTPGFFSFGNITYTNPCSNYLSPFKKNKCNREFNYHSNTLDLLNQMIASNTGLNGLKKIDHGAESQINLSYYKFLFKIMDNFETLETESKRKGWLTIFK
jgi:hypothetical protein